MALEDLLREAAAKGLTHLSLHPVHSEDTKTVYWRCTATPSTMHKYVHVTTLDPVEAVEQAIKALPRAGRRSTTPPGPPGLEGPLNSTPAGPPGLEGPPLTAAVNPEGKIFHTIGRDPEVDAAVPVTLAEADMTADEWSRFK